MREGQQRDEQGAAGSARAMILVSSCSAGSTKAASQSLRLARRDKCGTASGKL